MARRRHMVVGAQPVQLEMEAVVRPPPPRKPKRGGKRPGAGRKRSPGARESVPHGKRPVHRGYNPVHVTLRARRGLPSFRHQLVGGMLRRILERQRKRHYADAFQVVEFSIQDDHVHLIVEATGRKDTAPAALRAGISGFVIAFAKRLNRLLARKGKVWGDRWHGRDLSTPREVRNVLVYVFRNVAKHGARMFGTGVVDPLSSAPRFDGWSAPVCGPIETEPWPAAPARTWLLGQGWRGLGLLNPMEARRRGP